MLLRRYLFWGLVFLAGASTPALAAPPTQLEIAAQPAVKIVVTSDGWHRVTAAQLRAAGLPADSPVSALQLYADGVEHALRVAGNGDDVLDDDEGSSSTAVGATPCGRARAPTG
jgi:hypothetical protein